MSQSPFICFSVICATANGYKEIFSSCVDRPGLEYIFHLQGAVVKNARETLRGIDAHQLTVYQNSSAFANKKSPLDASCPLTGLGKTKDDALIILMPSTVRQEHLQDLDQRMSVVIESTASGMAKFGSSYSKLQEASKNFLRNYRPFEATPFPASLLYAGFGRLQDLAYNLSEIHTKITISQEEIHNVLGLVEDLSKVFEKEKGRQDKLYDWWKRIFAIVECKNEIGSSGDPMPQLGVYATKAYKELSETRNDLIYHNTAYPMFGIALLGTLLRVYAITITDAVNVEHLLDINLICKDFRQLRDLACLLKSVGWEIRQLEEFYLHFSDEENPMRKLWAAKNIPRDRAELNAPFCAELNYLIPRPLAGNYSPGAGIAYKKLYLSEEGRQVIKFTQFYGAQVHGFCAARGLAPQLYECKPIPGGYWMVRMERLAGDYSMLSAALFQSEEGAQIKTAVENVMQTLHKAGFVHGDFRYENIMYRFEQLEDSGSSSVDIKLLDFDFSGVAGQAVYPIALSNRISWHPTAGISQILKPEHDQHFFNQFGQSLLSKRHSPASSAIFLAPQSKGTTVETSTCRVVDIFAQTILPFPFEQQ